MTVKGFFEQDRGRQSRFFFSYPKEIKKSKKEGQEIQKDGGFCSSEVVHPNRL